MGTHPIFESDFDCLTEAIMSDTEAPAAAPAPVAAQGYSVETAVQETLKHAQHRDGLARGLNEAVRALERRDAICCILAENCDEANYVRLIEALCVEHQIPILKIGDNKTLGEWSGLCKITVKVTQSRLLAAHALSFVKSTIMLLGITSKTT